MQEENQELEVTDASVVEQQGLRLDTVVVQWGTTVWAPEKE